MSKPDATQTATQMTQPRGKEDNGEPAKPIEIPIPSKGDVLRDLAKTARPESEPNPRRKRRAGKNRP